MSQSYLSAGVTSWKWQGEDVRGNEKAFQDVPQGRSKIIFCEAMRVWNAGKPLFHCKSRGLYQRREVPPRVRRGWRAVGLHRERLFLFYFFRNKPVHFTRQQTNRLPPAFPFAFPCVCVSVDLALFGRMSVSGKRNGDTFFLDEHAS